LLSIVFAAMLGSPEKAADCSRRANAVVTLYEPRLKRHSAARCGVQVRLLEGDVSPVDFETMYRPMPENRIRERHRRIAARVVARSAVSHSNQMR
jgi:hypothetical protein